jgi:AraC family transcriptional activator of pobA
MQMAQVKNTIPVYDIYALSDVRHGHDEIIAAPFDAYLQIHPNLHTAHRHSFYHIVFFTEGAGYHTIDFQQFVVEPGQIYFMTPGQVHSWSFEGEINGWVVNFPGELFHPLADHGQYLEQFHFFRGIAADSVINLGSAARQAANELLQKVAAETSGPALYSTDMIRAWLVALFITVSREDKEQATEQAPQQNQLTLYNFRKMVDTCYGEKRLPKDYAAMLYITPNHLNALCNHLLGKPAGEVIRERILLEAKRLLVNASLTITQIAGQLSFTDNAHLTRFFKKYTGHTPEEFRKLSLLTTKLT